MTCAQTSLRVRLKAGALHLAVSVLVGAVALAVIFVVWYPGALAKAQGVGKVAIVLLAVDVIVGPLITTLVYRPGKRGLHFDLAVIAALQTTALLYGLKVIEGGRPAYVVFSVDRFEVIAPTELVFRGAEAGSHLRPSLSGPRWVAAQLPADAQRRSDILLSAVAGGPDITQMPQHYVELKNVQRTVIEAARPIQELFRINGHRAAEVTSLVKSLSVPLDQVLYVPLQARKQDGAVIIDRTTGNVLGICDLQPSFYNPGNPVPKE